MAKNSNCSKEILEILKDDDEIWVNEAALEKLVKLDPKLIDALLETGNKKINRYLCLQLWSLVYKLSEGEKNKRYQHWQCWSRITSQDHIT